MQLWLLTSVVLLKSLFLHIHALYELLFQVESAGQLEKNFSPTQRSLQLKSDQLSFHLLKLKSWASSAVLLIYVTCCPQTAVEGLFSAHLGCLHPAGMRWGMKTVFLWGVFRKLHLGSHVVINQLSSIWSCVLHAAMFGNMVEQPRMCVGARFCVIDGDSLQIYWSQKTLA